MNKRQAWFIFLSFTLLLVVLSVWLLPACAPGRVAATADDSTYAIPSLPDFAGRSYLPEAYRFAAPEAAISDYVLDYQGFVLEFDTASRNARWVCYLLCEANRGDGVERASNFRMDRRLGDYSPRDAAYRNSGYDRGHLAPAADMSYSTEAMYDSFFLSNASPQVPGFNRGIWKRLEEQVRSFAIEKDSIWIVTGPILHDNLPLMGDSPIRIPELFYKAIYKPASEPQGIAFVMRNVSATGDLQAYAITIDSLERLSGINFFPYLNEAERRKVQSSINLAFWFGEQ